MPQKLNFNLSNIWNELEITELENMEVEDSSYEVLDIEKTLSSESSIIVKGLSAIFMSAINSRATDIHLEAYENSLRIRYRVDGELVEIKKISKTLALALVSRVKILSNLDISEKRIPQDGRIKMKINGRYIDFRVAIMPTIYGEKVAIRILDKNFIETNLEKIGFDSTDYNKVKNSVNKSHGIILVTGPTGAGKSTTLHSILNFLNSPNVNILAVEDPVEYSIEGINQVQIKMEIGLTFASALRQFLRQDPDIIMFGEIRDGETAEIAIKASLTGHLVLSTLHTNDSIGTIYRLMNMGIEPYLISEALELVISQRLVRKLCPYCCILDKSSFEKIELLKLEEDIYLNGKYYIEKKGGCENCNETGFKGRIMVYEILRLSKEIKKLIEARSSMKIIEEISRKEGMLLLKEVAVKKALLKLTSLDEILKNYF
ncbi:MAG: GspE/PulE family protein [Fusobacteriaceae bacterium]